MPALFGILLSAGWSVLAWIFRTVLIKFVVLVALFYLVQELSTVLLSLLPQIGIGDSFTVISPGVWFFLDFFQIQIGVSMMISAFTTRFLIRRIPVIG